MGNHAAQIKLKSGRPWQYLIAIAVIYSFFIHSFFVGLVGAQLVASATDNGLSGFELCLNSDHNAPVPPGDAPDRHAVEHCMLCFGGADVAIAPPPQSPFQYVAFAAGRARHVAGNGRLRQYARYSIARPRGPPPSA
jgi:hypothetical protein